MIKLRPYQETGLRNIQESLRDKARTLYQCPTGGGKTTIFSEIISRYHKYNPDKQVLAIAHRKELIKQMHRRLGEFGISSWEVIGGRAKNPNYPVQVASIQTLATQKDSDWANNIGLVVIDEAHHFSLGSSYAKVYDRYPNALKLGVSATPCRLDGKPLKDGFDKLILGPSMGSLIEDRHLADYVYIRGVSPNISGVGTIAGDYNKRELRESFDKFRYGDLVESWKEYAYGKSTVVFAVDVEDSLGICQRYQDAGIKAEHLDGKSPPLERDAILARFTAGITTVLTNCGIVGEGLDIPRIECIQLARPTKSLVLYLQAVGRALRAQGDKKAIILDHADCLKEFGFPCDHRSWSLEGNIDRPSPEFTQFIKESPEGAISKQLVLPEINKIIEVNSKMELVSRSSKLRVDEIVKLINQRNWKPKAGYFRLREVMGDRLTIDDLRYFCRQVGKHHNWAVHLWEEHQEWLIDSGLKCF